MLATMDAAGEDQPLDFSRKATAPPPPTTNGNAIIVKRNGDSFRWNSPSLLEDHKPEPAHFTTPSPSPPDVTQTTRHPFASPGEGGSSPIDRRSTSPSSTNSKAARESAAAVAAQQNNILLATLANFHANSQPIHAASPPSPSGALGGVGSLHPSGVDRFGTSGGLITTGATPSLQRNTNGNSNNRDSNPTVKYTRPFKAYPRTTDHMGKLNPLNFYGLPMQVPITPDAIATQSLLATASNQQYHHFREQMLTQKRSQQETRKKTPTPNNNPMSHHTSQLATHQMVSSPQAPPQQLALALAAANDQFTKQMAAAVNQHASQQQHLQLNNSNNNNNNNSSYLSNSHLSDEMDSQMSNGGTSSGEGDMGDHHLDRHDGSPSTPGGGGRLSSSSSRKRGQPLSEDLKDEAYWERRRKNNEAAKRSRDARRAKEDEIAIRAAFLEQENLQLRVEVASLKNETTKLRCLLYNN